MLVLELVLDALADDERLAVEVDARRAPAGSATTSWRNDGITARAVTPRQSGRTGTSRQATTREALVVDDALDRRLRLLGGERLDRQEREADGVVPGRREDVAELAAAGSGRGPGRGSRRRHRCRPRRRWRRGARGWSERVERRVDELAAGDALACGRRTTRRTSRARSAGRRGRTAQAVRPGMCCIRLSSSSTKVDGRLGWCPGRLWPERCEQSRGSAAAEFASVPRSGRPLVSLGDLGVHRLDSGTSSRGERDSSWCVEVSDGACRGCRGRWWAGAGGGGAGERRMLRRRRRRGCRSNTLRRRGRRGVLWWCLRRRTTATRCVDARGTRRDPGRDRARRVRRGDRPAVGSSSGHDRAGDHRGGGPAAVSGVPSPGPGRSGGAATEAVVDGDPVRVVGRGAVPVASQVVTGADRSTAAT